MAAFNWPAQTAGTVTIAAVGTNGATAPTSSMENGVVDGSGNLVPLTLGQAAMAASVPVVLASNQASIPVAATLQAGSAIAGKVGIDQTTPGTTNGVQVVAALPAGSNNIGGINNAQINGVTPLMGNGVTGTGSQRVTIASDNTAFAVNATLQAGANTIGALSANQSVNHTQIAGVAVSTGNGVTGTGSQRVTIASDNTAFAVNATLQAGANSVGTVQPGNTANTTPWLMRPETAATATLSSVASSATTVSLLALNTSRKGAMFFNESTAILYLKFGATASLTSYTVQLAANAYYELPTRSIYTGAIDGIWSAANGSVRITELT